MLEALTQASLAPHVGETFLVEATPQQRAALHLLQLHDLKTATSQGGECFSLLLRGTDQQPLAQDTYIVRHAKLGVFPLFIVPVHSGDGASTHRDYHVTFNCVSS